MAYDEITAAIQGNGKWCYLYRAIDRDGNLVDSRLSKTRDMAAAKHFFQQAVDVVGSVRGAGDDRWAYFLSASDTRDHGQRCPSSKEYISR